MAHYGLLHQDRLNPLQWGRQNPNMPGAMSGDPTWGGALLGSGTQDPRAVYPLLAMGGAGLAGQIPRAAQFVGRGSQEIWDSPIGGYIRSGDWRIPAEALLGERLKKQAEGLIGQAKDEFDPMRRKILKGIAGSVVDHPLIPLAGELLPGKESIEAVPVAIGGTLELFGIHADNILRNYLEGVEGAGPPEDDEMEVFKGYAETGVYDPSDAQQSKFEIELLRREYEEDLYPMRRVLERIRVGSLIGGPEKWSRGRTTPITMFGEIEGVDEDLGIIHWMRDYEPDKYNQLLKTAVGQAETELEYVKEEIKRYKNVDFDRIDELHGGTGTDEIKRLLRKLRHVEEDLTWLDALLNDDTSNLPYSSTGLHPLDDPFPREIPHRDYAELEDGSLIREVTRPAETFLKENE